MARLPRIRPPLLLAIQLLLAVVVALFVWFDNSLHRGITFHPLPPPVADGSGPALGVNLFNIHLEPDPAAVRRSLELATAMGARYARMQVPWEDIEIHARGDFEDRRNLATVGAVSSWAKYDRLATLANEIGIELIWRLDRPPAWAREAVIATAEFQAGLARDGNSTGPPDNYVDYATFVGLLVERYDGDGVADAPGSPIVRHFQIWNEPNLKNEWNWREPQPEQFVALLRLGAEAIRAANPAALIIFPGLAPTDGLDSSAPMTELEYLDRVYRAGGAAYFDVMAAQAYGLGQPPDEHRYIFLRNRANWNWRRPVDTRNDVSRVVLLREVMEANGDHATPIWVAEFGWNSAPERISAERRFTWGTPVSEEVKAAYLVGQLERARDEWPWMGVMNVWMLRYGGYAEPNPDDPTPYFALITRDWQLLPAYAALRTFSTSPSVVGVGTHLWSHRAVEPIAGGWRVRFSGTRLALLGGGIDTDGALRITIDGTEQSLIPTSLGGRSALMTPNLPDGVHTLELQGDRTPELLLIERARPWGWLWDYGPMLLFGTMLLLGAASFRALGPVLDRSSARLRRLQQRVRHQQGFWARFIQPDSLVMLGLLLAIVIGYRGSAQLPLSLAGVVLFALLALARPHLALLCIPLILPLYFIPKALFDARFAIREGGISLPLHEVLLMVVTVATLPLLVGQVRAIRTWRLDRGALLREFAPIALFVVAALWGLMIATARGPALRELRWLVIEPLLFVGLALLLGSQQARPERYWLWLLRAWLVGGACAGLCGILQFFGVNLVPLFGTKVGFSEDSFLVEGVRRVSSLYGHPNNLGLAMGRYWPLGAAMAHLAFWGASHWREGIVRAWPYLLATLLCLGGLVVSFSRGAYLGALAAALTLAVALLPTAIWRDRRLWVAVATLLAGGGLLLLALVTSLGTERLSLTAASGGIRLQTWASALAMLRDHPFGIGLDQFGQRYPSYIAAELRESSEIYTSHPHNLLLDLALRMGPLGLIAVTWLSVRFYRGAWSRVRTASDEARRHQVAPVLLAGAGAAMTASLVHGLVDQFYFWPDLAYSFWLLIALERLFGGDGKPILTLVVPTSRASAEG